MGAILAGPEERIEEAWHLKFLFGGALRQAGVVAAAMLYALDHNVERLAEDHARAKRLAQGLADAGLPVDPAAVETNFIGVDVASIGVDPHEAKARIEEQGVLVGCPPPGRPARRHAPRRHRRGRRPRDRADPTGRWASLQQPDPLSRILRAGQVEHRVPSLSAAVYRSGEVVWSEAVGIADADGAEATPDTQYRIGSISKTFTAASIMLLRDEGKLDLDDPLSAHVPEAHHGGPTIRRLLAHSSGIQREPPGEVWETLDVPARAGAPRPPRGRRARARPGRALPLLEPRLRAARRGRRAASAARRSPISSTSG